MSRALRLVIGVGIFAAVLWWLDASWVQMRSRATLAAPGLALSFVATLAATVITAGRWKLIAESMGGTRLGIGVYVRSLAITRLLGQFTSMMAADLVGRGIALRASGSERGLGHSAVQVVVERVFDLLLPLALAVWALTLRDSSAALASAVAVFAVVGALAYRPLVSLAVRTYLAVRRRWASLRGRTTDEEDPLDPQLDGRLGPGIVALSVLRFAAVVAQFWGVALGVGLNLDAVAITAATVFAQLTGLLGVTPGGIGIVEIGWVGGLELVGLDAPGIALFVVAQRLMVILSFGVLSAISVLTAGGRVAKPAD